LDACWISQQDYGLCWALIGSIVGFSLAEVDLRNQQDYGLCQAMVGLRQDEVDLRQVALCLSLAEGGLSLGKVLNLIF
jgi:hypothetical protein